MAHISWVVKLTKLCNLRCSYCYEWNELGDSRKMPLEIYKRTLTAAQTLERRFHCHEVSLKSDVTFHGGEPFLVGRDYFAQIRALSLSQAPQIQYGIQTNLYSLQDWQIEEMKAFPLDVGVSFDAYGGVRTSAAGRQTEERVFANLLRLPRGQFSVGVISVLAAHNVGCVHDLLMIMETIGMPIRLLPVFAGPEERPKGFETSDARLIDALAEAAHLRLQGRISVCVYPVDAYIRIAVAFLFGIETPRMQRGANTGGVFVVERDGRIMVDHSPHEPPLGHILEDDVAAVEFADRLLRDARELDDRRRARVCAGCPFSRACDGYPAIVNGPAAEGPGCRFARPVIERIVAFLDTPTQRQRLEASLDEVLAGTEVSDAPPSFMLAV